MFVSYFCFLTSESFTIPCWQTNHLNDYAINDYAINDYAINDYAINDYAINDYAINDYAKMTMR